MSKRWKLIVVVLVLSLIIVSGGFIWVKLNTPIIPYSIQKDLSFTPDIPKPNSGWKIDQSTIKYDQSLGVLSIVVHNHQKIITLSEQTYPDILVFDSLVGSMNEFDELNTQLGKIALTHPKDLNGAQAAVADPSGLLIFAKPNMSLTNSDWSGFFNSLKSFN